MRAGQVAVLIVTLSLPAALIGQQSSASADVQLKAAMQTELVDGDLRKAIDDYRAIVARYADNRKVVASALLQLAGCYEKLGQNDARKTYEQIVRDYADQSDPAGRARARLAALGGPAAAAVPTVSALPRPDVVNDIQSLSPDGTKALFLLYDSGQNLAVYDFASRQMKPITNFGLTAFYAYGGVWSPDGRRVAYTQGAFSPEGVAELRVATLAGDSRVVFRDIANPGKGMIPAGWLPDGRTLLLALERADGTVVIGLIPDAGGPFTPLKSFAWDGNVSRPRVSPDGRFVAFAEGAAGMQDIQVLSLDGRAAHRITDRPGDDVQPMWSPDGRHLVFVSKRPNDASLWAVAIRDGQPVGEPVRVKDGMDGTVLIDWSARGLTYASRKQTLDIYTATVDRGSWQVGDPRPLAYSRTGRNTAPVWSPDGRFFAFVSGSVTEPDHRYVVVLPEGRGEAREYPIPTTRYANTLEPYDLRWFGDSSGLGFSGADRQGQPAVFQLSLATGQWKTHPSPAKPWTRIEWNGDGTKVFYARHGWAAGGAPAAIVELDLATSVEREISRPTGAQATLRGFRLSPDRRSLALTTVGETDGSLMVRLLVADIETGKARTIIEEKSGSTFQTTISLGAPAWTPDGRALLVARSTGTNLWPDFRIVTLEGSLVHSFVLNPALARQPRGRAGESEATIREAVLSPDGTRIAFMLASFESDTWLIENVLAGVDSRAPARR